MPCKLGEKIAAGGKETKQHLPAHRGRSRRRTEREISEGTTPPLLDQPSDPGRRCRGAAAWPIGLVTAVTIAGSCKGFKRTTVSSIYLGLGSNLFSVPEY